MLPQIVHLKSGLSRRSRGCLLLLGLAFLALPTLYQQAHSQDGPPGKAEIKPAEKSNATINALQTRAASNLRGSGQTTKIEVGDVSYTLPFSMPSAMEILRAPPAGQARPQHDRIQCELILFKMADPKVYPLVGSARLVQAHFKCTTSYADRTEVVYIDRNHLIAEKQRH